MWAALMRRDDEPSLTGRPGSRLYRIRQYLTKHPHSTATQVARALDLTQAQSNTALFEMASRDAVTWVLDASTERRRQVRHYCVSP